MPLSKQDVVHLLLQGQNRTPVRTEGKAYAPVNFALIKYWGKDKSYEALMLPYTSHLSVSMGEHMGTETVLSMNDEDVVFLNGKKLDKEGEFHRKVFDYISLFRTGNEKIKIDTHNTVPTGAGLASSASGFAALALALCDLYGWDLSLEQLSVVARLGSGSASRSVYQKGFVEFVKGEGTDTLDSVARPFETKMKNFYVGVLLLDETEKAVSSSQGMKQTVEHSFLYQNSWKNQVERDLFLIKKALGEGDFDAVGRVTQQNALAMHATALSAGVVYGNSQTFSVLQRLFSLQEQGVSLYCTQDAGPNLKLLAESPEIILEFFPSAQVYNLL